MVYKRKLTKTEAKRHFIYIDFAHLNNFPPQREKFRLVVRNEEVDIVVDGCRRIWAAMFWDRLPHFREGDTVSFSKNLDGSYSVAIE